MSQAPSPISRTPFPVFSAPTVARVRAIRTATLRVARAPLSASIATHVARFAAAIATPVVRFTARTVAVWFEAADFVARLVAAALHAARLWPLRLAPRIALHLSARAPNAAEAHTTKGDFAMIAYHLREGLAVS